MGSVDKNGEHAISISVSAFIDGSARKVWRSAAKEYPWIEPGGMQCAHRSGVAHSDNPHSIATKEVLGGKTVEAEGICLYNKEGEVAVWSGVYKFPIFPGLRIKLHCDSVLHTRRIAGGVVLEYKDFIYFGRALLGRMLMWYFRTVLKSDVALYNHNTLKLFVLKMISSG
ncbi:MAG: hypothetical protein QW458_01470 [Candidatus Micrarchaeaceae archaeon]